jgi:hypothetical protein
VKRILVVLGVLIAGLAFADSASAQNYVRDGFGKCMHVPQESRANGVQLRTWDCIDRAHLKWEKPLLLIDFAAEAGRQYFWLKNNLTGKCAAVHKGQHHDGSPVVQWDCESSLHFQWSELGNTGQIIHRESQKCLHSASGSNYATLVIRKCADIRDQISGGRRWTREGPYLRNGFGTCLHVPNESHENGVQLTTWDCIETPHLQIWWADINEEIYGGGFRLFISRMSDKCMAVHAGQKHDGAWVVQWSCSRILPEGGHNLQWKVENYQLMHRESGKCLHVASSAWNSPATLGTCAQTVVPAGMKWTIGG